MELALAYHEFTEALVTTLGISRGEMHMHSGLLIYVTSQIILGTRRASYAALGTVLFIEFLHEAMQASYYGSWRANDTLTDIALTLMWPMILAGVSVYRRARWNITYRRTGHIPVSSRRLTAGFAISVPKTR